MRARLVALLLLAVPLAHASTLVLDLADAAGDQDVYFGVGLLAPVPRELGCGDPATDVTRVVGATDGARLAVEIEVVDASARPSCPGGVERDETGRTWRVQLAGDGEVAKVEMRVQPSSEGTVRCAFVSRIDGRVGGWCETGPALAPRWSLPLAGEAPGWNGSLVPYDLRGAVFTADAYATATSWRDPDGVVGTDMFSTDETARVRVALPAGEP